jgi:ribosomal-protein-serine acetyltransferase
MTQKNLLMDFPLPITTPRLILRPPRIGDGLMLTNAISESFSLLKQFMPWAKEKPSIDDSEEFVRHSAANWILKNNDEPYLPLFIFDKNTEHFLGSTGYHHYNWEVPCIETGYWIRNTATGKGLMTEAVNAITQYAFKELRVKRITITCDIDNVRSQKIPERLGYQKEAILKSNRINADGKISDTVVYSRFDLSALPELTVKW